MHWLVLWWYLCCSMGLMGICFGYVLSGIDCLGGVLLYCWRYLLSVVIQVSGLELLVV